MYEDKLYMDYEDEYVYDGGFSDEETYTNALEIVEQCVQPTLQMVSTFVIYLILCCLLFRLIIQHFKVSAVWKHVTSAGLGIFLLHHYFEHLVIHVCGFTLCLYTLLYLINRFFGKHRGFIVAFLSIIFLVCCEFLLEQEVWLKIRASQMLVAMKAISVAFDVDSGVLKQHPTAVEFTGYTLCAGTCIFGPWVPYRAYSDIFKKSVLSRIWMWKVCRTLVVSVLLFSLSLCWIDWLIPNSSQRWKVLYREALAFRVGHYFVSFLSEMSAIITGFGSQPDGSWSYPVTIPYNIELPRSLVQVVIFWNMPMHHWLKFYVFKTTKALGGLGAVLCTYAVSSLLHGLNYKLAAVLMSLGFYTFIEYSLRLKLSHMWSACVLARPCNKPCTMHVNNDSHLLVYLFNFLCGVLAMFHLTYLGILIEPANIHTVSSLSGVFEKWRDLYFISHWTALATYVIYLIL